MSVVIIRTIQFLIPVLMLIALLLYKRKSRRMARFCSAMSVRPKCRKAYMLALSFIVILYCFSFFATTGASLWQAPALLLGGMLLRYDLTDGMLHWIHEDRVIQGIFFGLTLFTLMEQQLYSLSASMSLVIFAAMFYPSKAILEIARQSRFHLENVMTDEDIVDTYF